MEEKIISKNTRLYARSLIGRVRHLMWNVRKKELAPYHISPQQANILFIIYYLGRKATVGEVTRYSERAINTISKQMSIMEKDGLLKSVREVPKSNLLKFELTEKGLLTFKNSNKLIADKKIMSVLSEGERKQLISLLKRIISETEKYEPG